MPPTNAASVRSFACVRISYKWDRAVRILLSLASVAQHCLRLIGEIARVCGLSVVPPEQYSIVLIPLPQCVYLLLLWTNILVVSTLELFMNKASINI